MKCYTFKKVKVTLGIEVTNGRYSPGVLLGQSGPKSRYWMAPLGANHAAPTIQEGRVVEAFPLWRDDRLWLVAADNPADNRVLLRVNTQTFRARRRGAFGTMQGDPQTLLVGWGCHLSDDPETSSWDDGLVLLHPGDILEIRPQGFYSQVVSLEKDGQLVCLPLEDYKRRQATKKAAALVPATTAVTV